MKRILSLANDCLAGSCERFALADLMGNFRRVTYRYHIWKSIIRIASSKKYSKGYSLPQLHSMSARTSHRLLCSRGNVTRRLSDTSLAQFNYRFQRISRTLDTASSSLTRRYELQYLRAWRSSKDRFGWLRINTQGHHPLSPSCIVPLLSP